MKWEIQRLILGINITNWVDNGQALQWAVQPILCRFLHYKISWLSPKKGLGTQPEFFFTDLGNRCIISHEILHEMFLCLIF